MEKEEIKRIIEAVLFASDRPLSSEELSKALNIENKFTKELIKELKEEYRKENRSFQIIEIAQGFQVCTLPIYASWIKKVLRREKEEKLSLPALETLSIIAYRQPVTRAEIEAIRGVDVGGILKYLLERGLIKTAGRKDSLGKPILYRTTSYFLQYFGLSSLTDLPQPSGKIRKKEKDEAN
ncbi:MAG: SMC-Scp complex subunit ScpB [Candidatus Omnitrophota bacterium]|nr:MAG: SMC-Scp complex subunit ScpB [Candidatus Omnitrophota bacterium]